MRSLLHVGGKSKSSRKSAQAQCFKIDHLKHIFIFISAFLVLSVDEVERGYHRAIADINARGEGREVEASAELQGLCGNLDSRRTPLPLLFLRTCLLWLFCLCILRDICNVCDP